MKLREPGGGCEVTGGVPVAPHMGSGTMRGCFSGSGKVPANRGLNGEKRGCKSQ